MVDSLGDTEAMIAKTCELWGEAQANYEEFCFFTGLRPSEQIALGVSDCDMRNGTVSVSKARVDAHDKDYTKTGVDRIVELCPRALDCLKRQLALRAKLKLAGIVDHEKVFSHPSGKAFHCLQVQWRRWKRTQKALGLGQRDPYSARHTSVSWNLMVGKNPLWLAQQHGHSVAVRRFTRPGRRARRSPGRHERRSPAAPQGSLDVPLQVPSFSARPQCRAFSPRVRSLDHAVTGPLISVLQL